MCVYPARGSYFWHFSPSKAAETAKYPWRPPLSPNRREREEREREKERARGKRGRRLEEREKYGREYGVLTRLNFTDFLERFLINENNA